MKPPSCLRPVTTEERLQLEADRRTADACRVRRAHSVLASARRLSPQPIAPRVGCCVPTGRTVIRAFHTPGVAGWQRQATRPKTVAPLLEAPTCERRQQSLQQSPRTDGKPTGGWTLALAAPGGDAHGVTERLLRAETIRRAWQRLRTNGTRAQHWLTSPAPQ